MRVSINLLYDDTLYNVQCILHEKEWKKKKRNELEIIKIYTHRLVQARHIRQAAAHEYKYTSREYGVQYSPISRIRILTATRAGVRVEM